MDLRALSIITGKSCWNLYVDALVLNDDGNVLDALSLACLAALANTRIPRVEIVAGENGEDPEIELDDDMDNSVRLDLQGLPVITSVAQVSAEAASGLPLAYLTSVLRGAFILIYFVFRLGMCVYWT